MNRELKVLLDRWAIPNQLIPIKFYPYTSMVATRIISGNDCQKNSGELILLEIIGCMIKDQVVASGCQWDNKIVVECKQQFFLPEIKELSNIFIGRYDNNWSIGLGVWSENEAIQINLKP